jgi:hypothetical protein
VTSLQVQLDPAQIRIVLDHLSRRSCPSHRSGRQWRAESPSGLAPWRVPSFQASACEGWGIKDKATKVFWLTLLASLLFAVVLILVSDALGRVVGLGVEGGFYFLFPRIQDREFEEWQAAHQDTEPSSGWKALGWGALGLILFLVIAIAAP